MAQAAQANQEGQGVATLPSNLPESYAGGGIIAFEGGGKVERFQNTGSTGTTPAGRFFSGLGQSFSEAQEAAKLRNRLQMKYGPASALPGLFMTQTDEERQAAKAVSAALPKLSFAQLQQLDAQGPAALTGFNTSATAPTATPAANINKDLGPVPGTTDKDVLGGRPNAAAPSALPGAPGVGGSVGMPKLTLPTFTPTAAPPKTDYAGLFSNASTDAQKASEKAVKEAQDKLEAMDKPGFEAREARLGKREATQEKDSAMGRALNLMNLGFGIAGSKERTLAGALGNEGRQGIRDLIQGEAANRAARDRLEEYRDNLEQQKVAAKKGNYSAAQAAGQRAADDKRAYTQLNMQALHYGSSEATQRWQAENAQNLGATQLEQAGKLGIAQLQQRSAEVNAQLALGREKLGILKDQITAGNERARATLVQAENKVASTWQTSPDYRKAQEQSKKMPPIEAQKFMQQAFIQYKGNMLPSLLAGQGGGASVPSFSDMYKAME
jgi:hypothetical protein